MRIDLKKKTLFITGGMGGIGRSIVNKFAKCGANVITTSRYRKFLKRNNKIKFLTLDFESEESLIEIEKKIEKIKKIDYFINNAGVNKINYIYKISKYDLKKIHNVNLLGPIWLTHLIAKK